MTFITRNLITWISQNCHGVDRLRWALPWQRANYRQPIQQILRTMTATDGSSQTKETSNVVQRQRWCPHLQTTVLPIMSLILRCFCSLEIQVIEWNLTTMRERSWKAAIEQWAVSASFPNLLSALHHYSCQLLHCIPSALDVAECQRNSESFAARRHFICGVWELEIISDPFVAALVRNGSIHQAEHSRKVPVFYRWRDLSKAVVCNMCVKY